MFPIERKDEVNGVEVMTREEKIKFIQKAVFDIEGVTISDGHFDDYTEEMLNEEVEFYDYVLDK